MFDLILKNATLPDGRTRLDIACADGRIAAVEPNITAEAGEILDSVGNSSRRPLSIRICTWMPPCRSARRA